PQNAVARVHARRGQHVAGPECAGADDLDRGDAQGVDRDADRRCRGEHDHDKPASDAAHRNVPRKRTSGWRSTPMRARTSSCTETTSRQTSDARASGDATMKLAWTADT